jgi:DNA-binding MarR family transcriptional regulator
VLANYVKYASAMPPSNPRARQEPSEHTRLIDALVRASFVTTAVLSTVAAEHELSLTQLRVLAILRDRRIKMSELAAHLGLDKSTISGLVDRGEKRGLFVRTPNPDDGRSVDVALTDAGVELAGRGAAEVQRGLFPTTIPLAPAETRRLTALLERMLAAHADIVLDL